MNSVFVFLYHFESLGDRTLILGYPVLLFPLCVARHAHGTILGFVRLSDLLVELGFASEDVCFSLLSPITKKTRGIVQATYFAWKRIDMPIASSSCVKMLVA